MEKIKDVPEQLALLREFVSLMDNRPEMYKLPELQWYKVYLETKFGAKIPMTDKEPPDYNIVPDYCLGRNPDEYSDEEDDIPNEEDKAEGGASNLKLSMDGVIEDTDDAVPDYGDEGVTVTKEMIEESNEKCSDAMVASSEQQLEEAIKLLTEAIKLNPKSSVLYEKRANIYLKMKKPKKAIHDCNKAIQMNENSAVGYKWRGKARRMLGQWEESYSDLTEACKLDFDDDANMMLKEVSGNAKKVMEHRQKHGANTDETEKECNTATKSEPVPEVPDLTKLMKDPEVMMMFQDPAVLQAFQDIAKNPTNMSKYENNPQVQTLITKMKTKFGINNTGGT